LVEGGGGRGIQNTQPASSSVIKWGGKRKKEKIGRQKEKTPVDLRSESAVPKKRERKGRGEGGGRKRGRFPPTAGSPPIWPGKKKGKRGGGEKAVGEEKKD